MYIVEYFCTFYMFNDGIICNKHKIKPTLIYYYLLTSFIPVKGIWDCLYSDTEWFIFP